MFVPISNSPRPYAWGSKTAIADLLGSEASGGPEAELWLGAHSGSPSRILAPALAGGAHDLEEWIAADPSTTLGTLASGGRLPFLLKVLAAGGPLSLQAHPTQAQASQGFVRENMLGVPLDAPNRNYRDSFPKPEIILALEDGFDALCGFREVEQTKAIVDRMLAVDRSDKSLREMRRRLVSLPDAFEWIATGGDGVPELVDRVTALARLPKISGTHTAHGQTKSDVRHSPVMDALDTARMLAKEYPGDPGIVNSLLLNRVTLARGEALYLPAGNIHAYLHGFGIEVMTASDNVLRGGLTPKHVDVPELLKVLDFTPGPVPYLQPEVVSANCVLFQPGVDDFVLVQVTGEARYELSGPGIALCTLGTISIEGGVSSSTVERGKAVYITPDEATLAFSGTGELFLATTP